MLQRQPVGTGSIALIGICEAIAIAVTQQTLLLQGLQNSYIVSPSTQRGILMSPRQNSELNHKFNINDTTRAVFEIEIGIRAGLGPRGQQMIPHLLSHVPDL